MMSYEHKEALGKIFRGYVNILGNPQSQYRKEAAVQVAEALEELKAAGTSFEQLISEASYGGQTAGNGVQELLMLTDDGMERFIQFIRGFEVSAYDDEEDMSDIAEEQIRIAKWVKEHKKELIR